MKLFICGHGRHGKDKFAEYLVKSTGLSSVSSSWYVAEHVVQPWLKLNYGIEYDSVQQCFDDRHNRRNGWYKAIKEYNKDDLSRLSREIFSEFDIYVGIRDDKEFLASKDLADHSIWIEGLDRTGYRDPTCKITKGMCDIQIDNNGTLEELELAAGVLACWLDRKQTIVRSAGEVS